MGLQATLACVARQWLSPGRERGGAVTGRGLGIPKGQPQLLNVVKLEVHDDVQGGLGEKAAS
jgi:hypothetical protein